MITIDFMKKCDVFKTLTNDQLTAIMGNCCQEIKFSSGDRIFGENEHLSCLYLIMDGQVDLRFDLPGGTTSKENCITSISKYDAFGWSSLIPPHKSKLSSYCDTDTCNLVMVNKECLVKLFKKDAELGYLTMSNVAVIVGKRFQQLQELIATKKGYDIMFSW